MAFCNSSWENIIQFKKTATGLGDTMKLSDYVAQTLYEIGITSVFGYQGSSVSHLIDSLWRHEGISFIETRDERAAGFAATGFALQSQKPGVAIACSGPGAFNLLTAIADSYYDSIPCLFIVGQVSTHELRPFDKIRQVGFQESDIVSVASPITKYAVSIRKQEDIFEELNHAIKLMIEGRPGPVLVELPHNIQSAQIEVVEKDKFELLRCDIVGKIESDSSLVLDIIEQLNNAKRPLFIVGGGCRMQDRQTMSCISHLGIPIVASYRGKDLIDNTCPSFCGVIGAYGNRAANWATAYADCIVVLGSRLDGRQLPDGYAAFEQDTKIIVADIDEWELKKYPQNFKQLKTDVSLLFKGFEDHFNSIMPHDGWLNTVKIWVSRYPVCCEYCEEEGVNPNKLLSDLSDLLESDAVISLDVGQNQLWANSSLMLRGNQTLLQSGGLGSMGYAIPAAIGGYIGSGKQTLAICGDGGFQMSSAELETIRHNNLPIKVFVMNNRSLGLIRNYQDKALQGRRVGSVEGFSVPDLEFIARAYGFSYCRISSDADLPSLEEVLCDNTSWIIEVEISGESTNYPEPTYGSTSDNQSIELSDKDRAQIKEEAYCEFGQ